MPESFTAIWRQCLYSETCQAIWSLYRAGLHGSMCSIADIRDCGDPKILWEAILEAHRQIGAVQSGGIPDLLPMAALRHRAVVAAMGRL